MKFVEKTIERLTVDNIIKEEDKDIYIYGLRQGIFLVINVITIMVIGLLLGQFISSTIFLLAYIPLRSYAGGFHARTPIRCYVASVILITLVLWTMQWVMEISYLYALLAGVSAVLIWIHTPVESENKPLDKKEFVVYRRISRTILYLEVAAVTVFSLIGFREGLAGAVGAIVLEGFMIEIENGRKRIACRQNVGHMGM